MSTSLKVIRSNTIFLCVSFEQNRKQNLIGCSSSSKIESKSISNIFCNSASKQHQQKDDIFGRVIINLVNAPNMKPIH